MIVSFSHFGGEQICLANIDVPAVGEIITIDRVDYKVVERKWEICTDSGSTGCEVFVTNQEKPEVSFNPEPEDQRDVHTEHCCRIHGCKYGNVDEDCSVEEGRKRQSGPCEHCDDENDY